MSRNVPLATVAGALLLALLLLQTYGRLPNSPFFPLPASAPIMFLAWRGLPANLLLVAPSILFLISAYPVLRGNHRLPPYLVPAGVVLAIGSAIWYFSFFPAKYLGPNYLVVNVLLIATAAVLSWRSIRVPTAAGSLVCQWLLFFWLTTYGFPFWGLY